MEAALGGLGWRPADFWGATPADLSAAISGWRKAHGIKDKVPDMTPDEMIAAYEEMIASGG